MFNSFTNWINTNVQNVQQSMPNMPTVNMPNFPNLTNLPNLPNLQNILGKGTSTGNDSENNTLNEDQAVNQTENLSQNPEQAEKQEQLTNEVPSEAAEKPSEEHKSGLGSLEIDPQKALDQAKELGNNIGNMLFSFGNASSSVLKTASSNVLKTATHLKDVIEKNSIIGEFSKENEKFVSEKKQQQLREHSAIAPWVGFNQESKLKEEILELSSDSRNFLRSPPTGVDFEFDFNYYYPIALAILEEDPKLSEMRFKLVPNKISEEGFWKNYFYRVKLIKQSIQLEELNNGQQNYSSNLKNQDSFQQENEQTSANNEFVSDSYNESLNVDELKNDLKQFKLDNKKPGDVDDSEWDKELEEGLDNISAEELEKEINQMIGNE